MTSKLESFPTIEMPDQYEKHVEGEKEMTPEELRGEIKPEKKFQMPPRTKGELLDFTEEDPDQELIDAIKGINNTPEETISEGSTVKVAESSEKPADTETNIEKEPTNFRTPDDVVAHIEETHNIKVKPLHIYGAEQAYKQGTMTLGKIYSYLLEKSGLKKGEENYLPLAIKSYRETEGLVNKYNSTKNTALEDQIRESIARTIEKIEKVKDKNMGTYLENLKAWGKSLPEKFNEKL